MKKRERFSSLFPSSPSSASLPPLSSLNPLSSRSPISMSRMQLGVSLDETVTASDVSDLMWIFGCTRETQVGVFYVEMSVYKLIWKKLDLQYTISHTVESHMCTCVCVSVYVGLHSCQCSGRHHWRLVPRLRVSANLSVPQPPCLQQVHVLHHTFYLRTVPSIALDARSIRTCFCCTHIVVSGSAQVFWVRHQWLLRI